MWGPLIDISVLAGVLIYAAVEKGLLFAIAVCLATAFIVSKRHKSTGTTLAGGLCWIFGLLIDWKAFVVMVMILVFSVTFFSKQAERAARGEKVI